MLSDAQIEAGKDRLVNNKLTPVDVDSMVQNFRILVGHLETKYGYKFQTDLENLNDSDGRDKAAKMAACLNLLISKQFNVTFITGKTGVEISNTAKRKLFTLFAFNLLYPSPPELSEEEIIRIGGTGNDVSSSVSLTRTW